MHTTGDRDQFSHPQPPVCSPFIGIVDTSKPAEAPDFGNKMGQREGCKGGESIRGEQRQRSCHTGKEGLAGCKVQV